MCTCPDITKLTCTSTTGIRGNPLKTPTKRHLQLPNPATTSIHHSTNYREMCIANVPGISRTAVLLRGATCRSPLHRDDTYSYCTSRIHTSTHTECVPISPAARVWSKQKLTTPPWGRGGKADVVVKGGSSFVNPHIILPRSVHAHHHPWGLLTVDAF